MNFYCLYRERQQELRTVTRNTNEGGGSGRNSSGRDKETDEVGGGGGRRVERERQREAESTMQSIKIDALSVCYSFVSYYQSVRDGYIIRLNVFQ